MRRSARRPVHPQVYWIVPLLGMVLLGVAVLVMTFLRQPMPGSSWFIAGALLYVVGTFVVTILGNVPLNNRLEKVEPESDEAREVWALYLKRWVFWNHVRTLAALAGLLCLVLGLMQQS